MQELDVLRQIRRFIMFDSLTQKKVIKLINFFDRYVLEFKAKINYAQTYYDTQNKDLEKSAILLVRKTQNKKSVLTMSLEQTPNQSKFLEMINAKTLQRDIGVNESILKDVNFLRNSFKDMFKGALAFDPDYLLKKLQMAYRIDTKSQIYRVTSGTGLKLRLLFDYDVFYNYETKRKVPVYILTVEQLSKAKTDEEFYDLLSKFERYCKEVSPTPDSKIKLVRQMTVALPKFTKEQERQFMEQQKNQEIQK